MSNQLINRRQRRPKHKLTSCACVFLIHFLQSPILLNNNIIFNSLWRSSSSLRAFYFLFLSFISFLALKRNNFKMGLERVCEAFAKGLTSSERSVFRFQKPFASVFKELANRLQSIWKKFAKRLKRWQTPFARRFKRPKKAFFYIRRVFLWKVTFVVACKQAS